MSEKTKSLVKKEVKTELGTVQEFYTNGVQTAIEKQGLAFDEEQIACLSAAVSEMFSISKKEGVDIREMDQTAINRILQQISFLRLNVNSIPKECYLIIRRYKNNQNKKPEFDFGIEGDGYDKIVRRYGVGIKRLYEPWIIREGDEFKLPSFHGIKVTDPEWQPKSYSAKPIMVCYPVEYDDGRVEYKITDREGVAVNLKAHIENSIKTSFKYDDKKKESVRNKIKNMSLDEMFNDSELLEIMSPAWRDPHSRDAMIIRKMRNNAIKPIPKDFQNAYISQLYEETYEDYDQYRSEEKKKNPEEAIETEIEETAGTEEMPSIPEKSSAELVSAVSEAAKYVLEEVPAMVGEAARKERKRPF